MIHIQATIRAAAAKNCLGPTIGNPLPRATTAKAAAGPRRANATIIKVQITLPTCPTPPNATKLNTTKHDTTKPNATKHDTIKSDTTKLAAAKWKPKFTQKVGGVCKITQF